ncbi:uncharacterized protein LOC142545246 [Primulina tabacum]|uniref:uncharacterized protein LOC142545246 n=1 Tax=Primulina tabacum TaxID=48773 RepID=UPI003F5974D6
MDSRAGKISAGGPITQRKVLTVAFKDAASARDEDVRFCNRIGCSGRMKYSQTTNFGTIDRSKCPRPSFCSSSGNGIIGTSSKRNSAKMSEKKFNLDSRRKLFSQSESSVSGDSLGRSPTYQSKSGINNSGKITITESRISNVSSNIRPRKPSILPSSSDILASKSIGTGPSKSSTLSRYSPRSLKSGSKPDVIPPSCSSVSKSITENAIKKRSHEKDTSSSRSGRKTTALSSFHRHVSPSTRRTSISNSRRNSCIVGGDSSGTSSARARNSGNINKRMRPTDRENRQNFSSIGEPSDTETPNNTLSSDSSSNGDNSSTLMYFSSEDLGFNHSRNRRALPRDSLDGIAEVLLALDRIERAVLTHEQVLALEARFFITGLNLHDQHRDMRMDIDDMSYEELLALEERMGTVSTALSEETLSKCIRRSMYQKTPLEVGDTGSSEDGGDIKCSICQEEFELGDNVGTLIECDHGYHITCITQWLSLKNWCPICKGSAAPSQSFSSL